MNAELRYTLIPCLCFVNLNLNGAQTTLKCCCRRAKALLAENELRKLEKLLKKGKAITQEIIDDRLSKVVKHTVSPYCSLQSAFYLHNQISKARLGRNCNPMLPLVLQCCGTRLAVHLTCHLANWHAVQVTCHLARTRTTGTS